MNRDLTSKLFIASLFVCYWTVTPAILLFLAKTIELGVNSYFALKESKVESDVAKDLEKLKTEMAAVQLKLGFSRG